MDSSEPKYPLSWRQLRTPTRKQKRSKRWRKIYLGYRFPDATWTVTEGPWRKVKKSGSISYVRVECSRKHGGCGEQHDRILDTLVSGRSRQCIKCHHRRQREAAAARKQEAARQQAAANAGTGPGTGAEQQAEAGSKPEHAPD